MRYVKECTIILGLTMIGEWLNNTLPLPVPAGVYGLFLLLLLLCTGLLKLKDVEGTGNFLLEIMPVLFIPVSVGLLENFDAIQSFLIPLSVISVVSTIVVMIVTGKAAELMLRRSDKNREE